jgi:putative DNA primase/helicase
MVDFTAILNKTEVASSMQCVTITNQFANINGGEFLTHLKAVKVGAKDGSHFLRSSLKNNKGACLPRTDANTNSLANIVILDCDKRNINCDELDGAPNPHTISQILREKNIAHILYGSYSHYVGNKGFRYRIIVPTKTPYNKEQLSPTIEKIISLINSFLHDELLVNVKENNSWSQPWYYPRKPATSTIDDLYLEYLDGEAMEVVEPFALPPINNAAIAPTSPSIKGEISPINAFKEQHKLIDALIQYGYKKVYASKEYEKWLSPQSTSRNAGITVKNNKFFSHHDDDFNDGYWHDVFDLMRVTENLSEKEAIKKAAKNTYAPDGRTIDEHNKSLVNKNISHQNTASSQEILHTEILEKLNIKITPIDFRKTAKLTEKDKLKHNHLHVIVIETILALAKRHNWGICRNHDFIYLYNGAYWSLVDKEELKIFLGDAAERMSVEKYTALHFNFREQLYKQFIAVAHLSKPEYPKNIVFVNLKNGTFEITPKGTRLKPFNPGDFITYQLPFEFNPIAMAPLFQTYLDKVLPDKQLQNILSEYLGYVFIRTSTLKLEKTLLLFGKGANGKSVFYEIVRSLFGKENTSEYSLQTLTDDKGYQRAMIANKLVNYASEINGRLEASIFKQIVSGEPVEARLPYGNPFIITDYAKLIFNCNELPKDVEQTEAYFRRFLIIPFNITIPEHEQDKQLATKIIATELSGIFNWVLEGLKRLLERKQFTDCEIVKHTREQYEKESDSVRSFIDETEYKLSSSNYTAIKALYQEYRMYCQDDGYKPVNKTNFIKRLENYKIVIEKKNTGKVAFVTKW